MNRLLVLLSSLNADVEEIVNRINLECDIVIINQCDRNSKRELTHNGNKVYVYETTERGLSNSRNMALEISKELPHEIILFTDDDVQFHTHYAESLLAYYTEYESADLIIFEYNKTQNLFAENKSVIPSIPILRTLEFKKNVNPYSFFSSVRISIKKSFVEKNNLRFNENFGAGSNIVSHGEDSLFIKDCRKYKAKILIAPITLLTVDTDESTWRNISNSKFFEDKGILWRKISPILFWLFGIILVLKISREKNSNFFKSYFYFIKGSIKKIERVKTL